MYISMRSYISAKKLWRWALLGIGLAAILTLGAAFAACGDDEGDTNGNTPAPGQTGTPQAAELSGSITVKGSDTMVNLASAWAEDFSHEKPKVSISVNGAR